MAELRKAADIAPNTMARFRKNQIVSTDVLCRVCEVLNSDFRDITKYISDKELQEEMRMKKRIIAIMIATTMLFGLMACGTDITTEKQGIENTESTNENDNSGDTGETTELVEEESTEIEIDIETETEAIESTEESTETDQKESVASGMGSVNREDFVILDASWGYSNYVDYVEASGDRFSEAIIGYNSEVNNGQIAGQYGEDAVTNKGIHLGSTKDEVIAAYGNDGYDGPCTFKAYQVEGHMGVSLMQLEYLESPTHHYYLYFVYDENNILVGMGTSCWIEQ